MSVPLKRRDVVTDRSETMWTQIGDLEHELQYVQVGQWMTRVLTVGAGDETVVLLNGTSGHIEAWTHNIRELAQHFTVVAYDYPGHGFTTLATGDLVIEDYIQHLNQLLDVMNLEKVHLAGESLGGWIAVKYAGRYPERLHSAVLSAPGGRMLKRNTMERVSPISRKAVEEPTFENVKERLAVVINDKDQITPELVEMRRAVYARPGFMTSMEGIMALQDPEIRAQNQVTDEDYQNVRVPALFVWTDHEPTGGVGTGERLAGLMPQGELLVVEGAAHWPQWESPEIFNERTINFLESVKNHD